MSATANHGESPRDNDIRRYLSPAAAMRPAPSPAAPQQVQAHTAEEQPTPSAAQIRRRRPIITSSSGDDDGNIHNEHAGDAHQPELQPLDESGNVQEPTPLRRMPEAIQISDSDSDDMFIAGVVPRNTRRRTSSTPRANQPRRSERVRRSSQLNQPIAHDPGLQRNHPSRWHAEASEGTDEDDNDSADESDPTAADLYRSAIMGVRNRPTAMMQVAHLHP